MVTTFGIPTARVGDASPTRAAQPAAAPGFDDALQAAGRAAAANRQPSVAHLPTITLGQMLGHLQTSSAVASRHDVASSTTGQPGLMAAHRTAPTDLPRAVSDAWGSAADPNPTLRSGPGAAILQAGERYLGVPYRWGGTDAATGFDCSGFVQQVFADLGISLPRVSADQARVGTRRSGIHEAMPGDLLFWQGDGNRPNHIAIYAGDDTMLVAPRTGDVVRYQHIHRTPDVVTSVI